MRRPRIRTVLLLTNLALLLLPLAGIWLLRLYESALVRQTESELLAQGALVATAYRVDWLAASGAAASATPNAPATAALTAGLDLSDDPVLPIPGDAVAVDKPPEPYAAAVGGQLEPVLREAQRLTLASIRMTDAAGIVVATTGTEKGLSLAALQEVQAALAGKPTSTLRRRLWPEGRPPLDSISRTSDIRVFVALPVATGDRVIGAVLLSRTPRSIGQALYGKRYPLVALALLLVSAGALMAWVTATTVSRPIAAIIGQAQRLAGGDRAAVQPLAGTVTREADELSAALVAMAGTLGRRADYITGFAAAVSHEFKTPLTAMRGTIEVLEDHLDTMSDAERRRFLGNLAGDVDRLTRLVGRLLELARADMRHPTAARTELGAAIPVLLDRFRRGGLALRGDGPATGLVAAIDTHGLETVLANLLENVRQHAGPGAAGTVSWRQDAGQAVIEVSDDGPGVSPGNADKIFERFFTTARDRGGTGLGLPIVRSLLGAYGGTARLASGDGGARFVITLPLAS